MVLNSDNDETNPLDYWVGDIQVKLSDGTTVLIGPGQNQPYKAPYYELGSAALGGGSIGLVPFMFHGMDCNPQHEEVRCNWDGIITMEYYGPVNAYSTDYEVDGLPVCVERIRTDLAPGCDEFCDPCADLSATVWQDVTGQFSFTLWPNGNKRRIQLTRLGINTGPCNGTQYMAYRYRVRPRDGTGTNWLVCQTTGTPLVALPYWDDTKHWTCPDSDITTTST